MSRFYIHIFTAAAVLLAAFCCWGQNYAISTFAGQGLTLGDGPVATNARFGTISAVAEAPDGSIYVADVAFHQIRKVGTDGSISLFAGSTTRGYGGDGGPATSAMLDTPTALTVDNLGYVYIGDSGNHRVRVVSVYGNIQTIAGNGQIPPSPAASPAFPGEGGPATSAALNTISALAFDSSGDLLIADSGNNRVFRVSSGTISTVAGNATTPASLAAQPALPATLGVPVGVAGDDLGDIFICEQKTAVVRMIDPHGNMTLLVGTGSPGAPIASGSPLSYPLQLPSGMAIDGTNNNLYIAETGRISMYTPPSFLSGAASVVQTFAGDITQKVTSGTGDGGTPLAAGMNPRAITADGFGNVYVADSNSNLDFHNRVRVIGNNYIGTFAGGTLPTGAGDQGPATAAQLYFPRALALDPKGTVYIADTADNRVRAVTPDGKINAFAGTGTAGVAGNNGSALLANLNPPTGLALDSNGNLYIDDGSLIRQVNAAGTITTFAGGGSLSPSSAQASSQATTPALSASLVQSGSLAVDSQNDLYIDQLARVSEVTASTDTLSTVAGNGTVGYSGDNGPSTAAEIDDVAGIAVDSSGNLYIADEDNNRVRKVDSTGNITTIAGGGTSTGDGVAATSAALNIPLGVAVDGTGNVYIAEYGGNRVRMVDGSGNIHTIAGNGNQGFGGDGGIATNASLNGPTDVKVDSQGNVYIADSLNSTIRKLTPVTAVPTPSINTITNGGSLSAGPVAPGERVILTGTALGPYSSVMFDSHSAPVLSSTFTSTMVVVPYEVAGQTTSQVTVTTSGATSASFAVQIAPSAPGIYTLSGNGQGEALALGGNGGLNSLDNPVIAGNDVTLLCTGAGVLSPAVATGVPVPLTTPSPLLPVTVTMNGEVAQVAQAYAIPGTLGEFAVDVIVPDDANSSVSVAVTVGNATSQMVSIYVNAPSDDSGDGSDSLPRKGRPVGSTRPLPPVR